MEPIRPNRPSDAFDVVRFEEKPYYEHPNLVRYLQQELKENLERAGLDVSTLKDEDNMSSYRLICMSRDPSQKPRTLAFLSRMQEETSRDVRYSSITSRDLMLLIREKIYVPQPIIPKQIQEGIVGKLKNLFQWKKKK